MVTPVSATTPPPVAETQPDATASTASEATAADGAADSSAVPIVASASPPTDDPLTASPSLPTPLLSSSPPLSGRAAKRQPPAVSFDKTLENILKLRTHDLEVQDDDLVIVDKEKRKKSRGKCVQNLSSSPNAYRRVIPLYNVLWASVSDDERELVIEYAEVSKKSRVTPVKLPLPLVPSGPDWPTPADVASWAELLRARAYGDVPQRRRAYVLVNPYAGPGGAVKKWECEAQPLMEAARMQLTVVRTEYSGQAVDLCAALDIDAYDMVIPCSGDGLPHECFNGLGRRPDARRALERVAVAHLPCGSGNAMACNLYGTHRAGLAALSIIKGVVAPLDLVSITYGSERRLSFLSQAVGVIAEVDLGTEHLRWMGGARFTWGFLERLLQRKVYPCDLAVKVEIDHKDAVRAHYSRHQSVSNSGAAGSSTPRDPLLLQKRHDQAKLGSSSMTSTTTTEAEAPATATAPGRADADADAKYDVDAEAAGLGLPPLKFGTVNDTLPDDWEVVSEDKMGSFYCGNMAYMAPDANFFSAALMNDGLMDLVTVAGDIAPTKSLGMLLSVEDNRFFENPLVRYRKISGFRLTPKHQKDGYISIDGERIPFVPFQAEVHSCLGRVIAKRTTSYEAPGPRNWDKITAQDRFMA